MAQTLNSIQFGLAMSFFRDPIPALTSAKDFAEKLGDKVSSVPLLLEVDLPKSAILDGGASLGEVVRQFGQQGWKEVLVWTRDATEVARQDWTAHLVNPVDVEFSFGGINVKTQALGAVAGCSYVARFDPGCGAPSNLVAAIERHIGRIEMGQADVVAGTYDNRFAIRTDFLPQKPDELHRQMRAELFQQVQRFTRVVPEAQIIGGALYTCRAECPPPPPLGEEERLAIVLSDDGFMKTVLGDRAFIDTDTVVLRSNSGFPLSSHDYRVRLSMMAALDQLWQRAPIVTAATTALKFYQAMGKLVANPSDVQIAAARTIMEAKIDPIARGVERYRKVRAHWKECLEVLGSIPALRRAIRAA